MIKPELTVHDIAKLKDGNEVIHMTFADEQSICHNIWLIKKDSEVVHVDISWPYKGLDEEPVLEWICIQRDEFLNRPTFEYECPKCRSVFDESTRYCPDCGTELD